MATLNTLRTRGALFLSIVIGVALIAFLLGDLTGASSVFQSRRNRVGSVEGNNIDYMEFARDNDNLARVIETLYGRNSLSAEEHDQVRDMVWESYIRRYAYEPGFHRMGLTVGEDEQIDMVQGRYISPVIASLFGSPQTGVVDQYAVAQFVADLESDQTGHRSAMWEYAKDEMVNERSMAKFVSLVRAGIWVNDLEVARGVKAANTAYDATYAMVPFSSIADSLVQVSQSEVRSYYRAHRNDFRQSASRDIEYTTFEIAPSEGDYQEAAAHIAGVAEEFAAAEEPMQYASLNSQERVDPSYYSAAQLTGDEFAIAFGERQGEMAGPTFSGNIYKITRVAAERMMPDSVGARHIVLPAFRAASADSIVDALKKGADIFALAPQYSFDTNVDLGIFPPETMMEPLSSAFMGAAKGDVFKVEADYGVHVIQMTHRSAPVRKVQLATITYHVEPSAVTEQAAYARAHEFLSAAAGSRANFDAAIASTGAIMRVATIGQNDREVMGLADSRELVRWSFNAKPGTVSPIFETEGNYLVAVLTDAKEAGIADIRDVSVDIAQILRTDKKAATIGSRMQGLSVDQIAADVEGASKGELPGLRFAAFYEPSIGVEPAVIGAPEGLSVGATSKPIKGYGGVYVISVNAENASQDADAETERVRLQANAETMLEQRIVEAIIRQADISDYRAKFF